MDPDLGAGIVSTLIDIFKNEGFMPDGRSSNYNGRVSWSRVPFVAFSGSSEAAIMLTVALRSKVAQMRIMYLPTPM